MIVMQILNSRGMRLWRAKNVDVREVEPNLHTGAINEKDVSSSYQEHLSRYGIRLSLESPASKRQFADGVSVGLFRYILQRGKLTLTLP